MSNVRFTSTKLINAGKKGILTPDKDGYYELVIGGLNTFNSAGEYYTADGAKQLFEQSSTFMRRVNNGCLKGEVGHPKKLPGMSNDEYINRILSMDEKNICCHFKEVWLDFDFGKKNPQLNNPALVAIMALVKPSGPKGDSLKASLDNHAENVCFSIRALTKDYYQRGQTIRTLTSIVCWDNVSEGGIAIAHKWQSPSLEELSSYIIQKKALETIAYSDSNSIATESTRALALEAVELIGGDIHNKQSTIPLISKW